MGRPYVAPDLEALSKLSQSFANAYPALATRLSERSLDPDVERLLEAFAYLGEHVRKLVDESAPDAAQSFADAIAPELSRPFPPATILELTPPPGARRVHVPAGTEFESVPVHGTSCRFTSWSPFDLVPWTLERAELTWSPDRGQALELELAAANDGFSLGVPVESLFPLRLHFSGDPRTTGALTAFLRDRLAGVDLRRSEGPHDESEWMTLPAKLDPWGLRADEPLFPPEPFEHPGLRLLREYLTMPAKLAFVTMHVPELPVEGPSLARRVALRFRFDEQLPAAMRLTRDDVRLNAAPVVNVFETTTDPVRPRLERPVHRLRPAGLTNETGEVHSVLRVRARLSDGARAKALGGMVDIAPFHEHEAASEHVLPDVFYVAHVVSEGRGRAEIALALGSPADAPPVPDIDFLSIDVRASNGLAARALRIGDVRMPTSTSPSGVTFRNITAVTPYAPPPYGEDLRWRTLAMMTLSALPITDPRALRTLLTILDLRDPGQSQAARAHAQRVASIREVDVAPGRARAPSTEPGRSPDLVFGHEVRVTVSQEGFDGEGEVLVFGDVLSRLFAHEAPLGSFVRTTLEIAETGKELVYPPLHGDREFSPLGERR
jgi:type VI secretion system protein ImpG